MSSNKDNTGRSPPSKGSDIQESEDFTDHAFGKYIKKKYPELKMFKLEGKRKMSAGTSDTPSETLRYTWSIHYKDNHEASLTKDFEGEFQLGASASLSEWLKTLNTNATSHHDGTTTDDFYRVVYKDREYSGTVITGPNGAAVEQPYTPLDNSQFRKNFQEKVLPHAQTTSRYDIKGTTVQDSKTRETIYRITLYKNDYTENPGRQSFVDHFDGKDIDTAKSLLLDYARRNFQQLRY